MSSLQPALAPVAPASPVRSFIDLRAFARDARQGVAAASSAGDDPFLANRRTLDWAPDSPVTAGVITLNAGSGAVRSLPADEFIFVHEGRLTLAQQGEQQPAKLTLEPGQSAVIPHGAAFAWSATGPVSLLFTRYNLSQPGNGAIVPIQQSPELKPSGTPPAGWPGACVLAPDDETIPAAPVFGLSTTRVLDRAVAAPLMLPTAKLRGHRAFTVLTQVQRPAYCPSAAFDPCSEQGSFRLRATLTPAHR